MEQSSKNPEIKRKLYQVIQQHSVAINSVSGLKVCEFWIDNNYLCSLTFPEISQWIMQHFLFPWNSESIQACSSDSCPLVLSVESSSWSCWALCCLMTALLSRLSRFSVVFSWLKQTLQTNAFTVKNNLLYAPASDKEWWKTAKVQEKNPMWVRLM